jgi:CheY-like chemotaxis protein
MKRILFVDDEVSILDGLKRMLRPMRREWGMAFAAGGEPALTLLEGPPFDVIVTDMRMPGMDGATLLEIVREKQPSTLRIILSGHTELQASLRAGIARATSFGEALGSKMLSSLVGPLRELPSLPRVFSELKLALAQPNEPVDRVSQIVEQDIALSAKLLQVVNSSFFGLARDVTNVRTAVSCLGITVLHELVLTLEVFRSFTANEFVSLEYIEEFHRHAQLTARIAAGISQKTQTPPTVVLAALLLAHEREALEQGAPPPEFDMDLLLQAGLGDRLPK